MSTTSVEFGGVTFVNGGVEDADGVLWVLARLSGWGGSGEVSAQRNRRSQSHGEFAERAWRGAAVVVVDADVVAPTRALAAAAKRRLTALLADGTFSDVTVDDEDEGVLSASVRLAVTPTVEWYAPTAIRAQFQLYQADSVRYGPVAAAPTGFPEQVGGLEYDLYTDGAGTDLGYLDYGAASTTGQVTLTNPGTAPSWPQFQVEGPVDAAGFEIVTVGTGARVRFEGGIPAGSSLVLDAATGVAAIDGAADRGGLLTWRDWAPIGPGESATFAFVPLGSAAGGVLTVTVRPAYW